MTRQDFEWLAAHALLSAGKVTLKWLREETKLNFAEMEIMWKCRKCGSKFFSICTDCTYRAGSRMIVEDREDNRDTLTGFALNMRYWNLYNTLAWMRVQTPLEQW